MAKKKVTKATATKPVKTPAAKKVDKANPKAVSAPKPERPKKATKAQRMNALDDKAGEVMSQFRKFKIAESAWDAAHAEAGAAKKEMELQQEKLNALIQEMSDISSGKTKLLPFTHSVPTGGAPQPPVASTVVDSGGATALTTLIGKNLKNACPSHYRDGVGLSEKQVETLSKAIDGEKTIAGLEKFQRTNPIWHQSIKGFGEAAITKLQDAHEILRRAFPIPSPDDKPKPPTPAQSSTTAAAASNGKPVDPLTAAFTAGQEACRGGHGFQTCPHPSGTPLAMKWIEGHESEKSAKPAAKAGKAALTDADKDKLRKAQEAAASKA